MINKKDETKKKAMKELFDGIKSGSIKITVKRKCGWCGELFNSDKEFDAHRIDGKTFDKDGKRKRICPR